MTEDQIQQCKQKLLLIQKKHQELEASYAEEAREKEENGSTELHNQAAHGRLSLMQAMERQKTLLNESRQREMLAEKIEGGLRRIDNGSFGRCFYCEEAIGFSRLHTNPTHTRCKKCVNEL